MCKPIENVTVDNAVITPRIAHYLGCLQANDNDDLRMMIGNISEMKRFFISLQNAGIDASEILGYLGYVQYIEDALKELIFDETNTSHGKEK